MFVGVKFWQTHICSVFIFIYLVHFGIESLTIPIDVTRGQKFFSRNTEESIIQINYSASCSKYYQDYFNIHILLFAQCNIKVYININDIDMNS